MTLTRFALTALVVTLFAGAGAAVPTDNTQAQSASASGDGPHGDLPGSVPEFVGGVRDTVGQFFDGVLGPAVSETVGTTTTSIETSDH